MRCRGLPYFVGDGLSHMARDQALLESVAASTGDVAVISVYGWSTPTLSLGYFQSVATAEDDPRWRGVPIVRRPTGGSALLHDREVTYSVVIPRSHPLASGHRALYREVHNAFVELLRNAGFDARLRGPTPDPPRPRPFLCFADQEETDVVVGETKVVGSAQRRRSGAVLQHGSLLLGTSPLAIELPGLWDLGVKTPRAENPPIDPEHWAGPIQAAVAAVLNLAIVDDVLRPDEQQNVDRWRAVLASSAWRSRR